jgi:N-acyl-D-amino-acid deacylase
MLPLSFLLLTLAAAEPAEMDIVIQNATIHDGSGKAGYVGDVAIAGDKIVGVGKFPLRGKPHLIDGTGLIVAPGFIDLHTHCDTGDPSLTQVGGKPNKSYTTQGVTTVVTGNCGSGPVDVKEFYAKLEKGGVGTNVAHQATHNSIRSQVMGNENRVPTSEELTKMENLVDQAMKDGAWGLSTGLIYNPGTYSQTAEIIALAKISAKHQGMYASHIRDEGAGLLTAIEEAIRIGKEAQLPVHVSHIKASGKRVWGKSADAIALILRARDSGQMITADQYPYIASSTSLSATLIPSRFREGSTKEYRARYDDAERGPQIRKAIEAALALRDGGKTVQIARYRPNTQWQGKNLAEIAAMENRPAAEIVIEMEKAGGAGVVNFGMSEEDVRVFMKQPWVATASDGSSQVPKDTVPHPRSYGTFPRKIGLYSIKEGAIPLEQAIRSASGLPADILHLPQRGYLKPNYFADIVVFDPKTYRDVATFEKPHQHSTGVKYLLVNGKLVIDDGKYLDTLAGRPLRKTK